MEGNFSSKVRDVIQFSREEALRLGHDYIGTEHLILGIVRLGDGVAVRILKNLDCDLFKLKKTIEDTVRGTGGSVTVGNIPLTKQAEKVLRITYLEAKLYKSDTIGTEHLLLSLLRDDENIAAQILQQFSVSYDAVREELDLIISGKSRDDVDDASGITASTSSPSSKGSQSSGSSREKRMDKSKTPVLDNFGRDLPRCHIKKWFTISIAIKIHLCDSHVDLLRWHCDCGRKSKGMLRSLRRSNGSSH